MALAPAPSPEESGRAAGLAAGPPPAALVHAVLDVVDATAQHDQISAA